MPARGRSPGRVIAATNRKLGALRRDGRFRDDFHYRLCSDVIEVPTLRPGGKTLHHRRVLLTGRYAGDLAPAPGGEGVSSSRSCVRAS